MISERLSACQNCGQRQRNRCRLANQIVSVLARMPGAECPIGRWSNPAKRNTMRPQTKAAAKPEALPAFEYPQAPHRTIKRLAAVTCHYNPCGYKLLEEEYRNATQAC
jgi:hypothetical protein